MRVSGEGGDKADRLLTDRPIEFTQYATKSDRSELLQ